MTGKERERQERKESNEKIKSRKGGKVREGKKSERMGMKRKCVKEKKRNGH